MANLMSISMPTLDDCLRQIAASRDLDELYELSARLIVPRHRLAPDEVPMLTEAAERREREITGSATAPAVPALPAPAEAQVSAHDPTEEFLASVLPEGEVLFGVRLGKPIQSFETNSVTELARWCRDQDAAGHDVYVAIAGFKPKEQRGSRRGRVRENVSGVSSFWLDIDCGGGKPYATQSEAYDALAAFRDATGIPSPTLVVSSGAGLHVYWVFERGIEPQEWTATAKRLRLACERHGLAADHACTTDIVRILRPVGTHNHKTGSPRPVEIFRDDVADALEFDTFRAALEKATGGSGPAPAADAHANDALSAGISEQLHRYLAGLTADQQFAVLDTACAAVPAEMWAQYDFWALTAIAGMVNLAERHAFDRERLLALLLKHSRRAPGFATLDRAVVDEKFEVAGLGHCDISRLFAVAEQHGFDAAAVFAPVPASAPVGDPERPYPNELIAQANLTRRYALLTFENSGAEWFDLMKRKALTGRALDLLHASRLKLIGKKASRLLSEAAQLTKVDHLGYNPAASAIYTEEQSVFANQYIPPPPAQTPTPQERALLDNFLDYLFPREEDQEFRHFYVHWLAHLVQHPDVKLASALLFIGDKGVGKNTACLNLPEALVGRSNAQLVSNKVLRSAFNAYAGRHQLLYFDEVFCNGSWDASDQANGLKSIVTDARIEVHAKGRDSRNVPNRIVITASSNHRDAMYLEDGDRRWAVYELKPQRQWRTEVARARYFTLLHRFLASDRGSSAARGYFSELDLSGFDPQKAPPVTEAKRAMTEYSRSPEAEALIELWQDGAFPFDRDVVPSEWARSIIKPRLDWTRASDTRLGIALRDPPFHGVNIGPQRIQVMRKAHINRTQVPFELPRGRTHRLWIVRNHAIWREASNEQIARHIETGAMPGQGE